MDREQLVADATKRATSSQASMRGAIGDLRKALDAVEQAVEAGELPPPSRVLAEHVALVQEHHTRAWQALAATRLPGEAVQPFRARSAA